MPQKSIRQALNEALAQEMRRDPTRHRDRRGCRRRRRHARASATPMAACSASPRGCSANSARRGSSTRRSPKSAIMGAAAGAAVTGLRPVAELMFSDFFGVCFDQIFNQAAKFRYMFGGKAKTPLVIRTMIGAGRSAAAQHSQSPYHIFTSVPGLKCVVPSNAYDAKGLLIQAIRDDDPVIFCEHKLMYDLRAEVPDEPYTIPFGEANIVRDGDDVTVVALARMVHYADEAAEALAKDGIECRADRPAHDLAARRGHDPRERRAHRPAGHRRRGDAALQHGDRHRRAGRRQGVRRAEGADPAGDRAAHPGAVRPVPRKALHPEPREDRRRGARGARVRRSSYASSPGARRRGPASVQACASRCVDCPLSRE